MDAMGGSFGETGGADAPDIGSSVPAHLQKSGLPLPHSDLVLMEPTIGGNYGDASFAYEIRVPPGRHGMAPSLSIVYTSAGGPSWLGHGWSLTGLPMIAVDTKFGAPTYSSGSETESYIYEGSELSPRAYVGGLASRSTSEKVFYLRKEHLFSKITRINTSPKTYAWKVQDSEGATSYFGMDSSGNLVPSCTLATSDGNIFQWNMCERRDLNGNYWKATYTTQTSDGGTQIYPSTISYTGSGSTDGPYKVQFYLKSGRNDVHKECRSGLCVTTAHLLDSVSVTFQNTPIRYYTLSYGDPGAFGVTLLRTIYERSADNDIFGNHTMDYYDDGFGFNGPSQWPGTPKLQGAVDFLSEAIFGDDTLNYASGITSTTSTHGGYYVYGGIAFGPLKELSAGVQHSDQFSFTHGKTDLLDITGDHLPDMVFYDDGIWYCENQGGAEGTSHSFSSKKRVTGDQLSDFHYEIGWQDSTGASAYAGATVSGDVMISTAFTQTYWADVNGDGFMDIVDSGSVHYGYYDENLQTVGFTTDMTKTQFVTGTSGSVKSSGSSSSQLRDQFLTQFRQGNMLDSLIRWVAPYSGTISYSVTYTLQSITTAPTPSIRVAMQQNGGLLWTPVDFTPSNENAFSKSGSLSVSAGDRIYFRVGTDTDGAGGNVKFSPSIHYTSFGQTFDANHLDLSTYNLNNDFSALAFGGAIVSVQSTNPTLLLSASISKNGPTSDGVTFKITNNGTVVYTETIGPTATGPFHPPSSLTVQKYDQLKFALEIDSSIDLTKISTSGDLQLTYSGTTNKINATYAVDTYPVALYSSSLPTQFNNTYGTTNLIFNPSFSISHLEHTVPIVFTVKSNAGIVFKGTMEINDHKNFSVPVTNNTNYFMEFFTRVPLTTSNISGYGLTLFPPSGRTSVPVILYTVTADLFTSPYRGWSYAGYNSTGRETSALNENDLKIPTDKDQVQQNGNAVLSVYPDYASNYFALGQYGYINGTGCQSTHLGPGWIDPTTSPGFVGGRGTIRVGISSGVSGTLGVIFASVSASIMAGTGLVDMIDMNGDLFPDIVGTLGIAQYTDPTGDLGDVELQSYIALQSTTSNTIALGCATPSVSASNGQGKVGPSGSGSARGSQTGNMLPQLGLPISLGASIGSSHSQDLYIFTDINGDGITDTCSPKDSLSCRLGLGKSYTGSTSFNNSAQNTMSSDSTLIDLSAGLGFSDGIYGFGGGLGFSVATGSATTTLLDVTGDGKPDILHYDGSTLTVQYNLGTKFSDAVTWGSFVTVERQDLTYGISGYGTVAIDIGFILPIFLIINVGANGGWGMSKTTYDIRDVDGDGFPDFVFSPTSDDIQVSSSKIGRTNLLKTVHRPLGSSITVDYKRAGNTRANPSSRWVVSKVDIFDGFRGDGADDSITTYSYTNGNYHIVDRFFCGFADVVATTMHNNNPHRVVRSHYDTSDYYHCGDILWKTIEDANQNLYVKSIFTYDPMVAVGQANSGSYYVPLVAEQALWYEGLSTPSKSSTTTYTRDKYGNPLTVTDQGDDDNPRDDLRSTFEYAYNFSGCLNNNLISFAISAKEQDLFNTKTLSYTETQLDCSTGNPSQLREFKEDGSFIPIDYTYDSKGNRKSITYPPNLHGQRYNVSFTYDTTVFTYVTSSSDILGYSDLSEHEYLFGELVSHTDVTGAQVQFSYDKFGRMTSFIGPLEINTTYTTVAYEYHLDASPAWAVARHFDVQHPIDPITTVTFVDGLQRFVQIKTDTAIRTSETATQNVMTISGRHMYDDLGEVITSYYPTYEALGTPGVFSTPIATIMPTTYTFDVLGRPLAQFLPNGANQTYSYGFSTLGGLTLQSITAIDPNGIRADKIFDVKQNLIGFRSYLNNETVDRTFKYDPLQRLIEETDALGHTVQMTYDMLGRLTSQVDEDTGTDVYTYDDYGHTITSVTLNQELYGETRYDFNYTQMISVDFPLFPGNSRTYTWGKYGESNYRAGKPYIITDATGNLTLSFDALGRETVTSKWVVVKTGTYQQYPSYENFVMSFSFDSLGRTLNVTYPDSEVVSYGYNSGGRLQSVAGLINGVSYQYINFIGYDYFDSIGYTVYGNTVSVTSTFEPKMRWLSESLLVGPTQTLQDISFTYDNKGLIIGANDGIGQAKPWLKTSGGPLQTSLKHDTLYRTTSAHATYLPDTVTNRQFSVLTAYDKIDNVLTRQQYDMTISTLFDGSSDQYYNETYFNPKNTYNLSYTYNSTHPHGPSIIMQELISDWEKYCFQYDESGNIVGIGSSAQIGGHPGAGDAATDWAKLCQDYWNGNVSNSSYAFSRQTSAYDDEFYTQSILTPGMDNPELYTYDFQGWRVIKQGDAGTSVYANRYWIKHDGFYIKYIFAGGERIAAKQVGQNLLCTFNSPVSSLDCQYFFHRGTSGSTNWITDIKGNPVYHFEYMPNGEGWVTEIIKANEASHTGLPFMFEDFELDATGMYYLGKGGYYSPQFGLKMSPHGPKGGQNPYTL